MNPKQLYLIFAILFLFIIFAGIVDASVKVNYAARYGVIQNDLSLSKTSTAVQRYDVLGYACANVDCSVIGARIAGLTAHTEISVIQVEFPTTLASQYGYVLYFYKNGYIGWEQKNVIVYGIPPNQPLNAPDFVYLSKKQTGYAPILNLNVVNEIALNVPLQIDVTTGIDADTYAAIDRSTFSNIPLNENVQTSVTLQVLDSSDNVLYTEAKSLSIPYSQSQAVSFDYIFSQEGDYNIIVYTDVPDAKIINSVRQSSSARNIRVISPDLHEYSYTIINGLNMNPATPGIGENVVFTFDYLSNYANDLGNLNVLGTDALLTIMRNGQVLESRTINLPATADVDDFGTYTFSRVFGQDGTYTITVIGSPHNALGDQIISSTREIVFNINVASQPEAPTVTITSPVNGRTYNTNSILLEVSSNQVVSFSYSLNGGNAINFNSGQTINVPEGTHQLIVYGTNANGVGSSTVNFSVDIPSPPQAPTITIISPVNGVTYITNTILLDATSDQTVVWSYSLDGGVLISFIPGQSINIPNGQHTIIISGTNANGVGSATATFNVNVPVNPTVPVVTLVSPVNGATYIINSILLDATANQVVTWTYILDNGNAQSFTPGQTITIANGVHSISVYGTNANGVGSAAANFIVDAPVNPQAPVITILSPLNGRVYTSNLILLNATANQAVTWTYVLDNGNSQSFTPGQSINVLNGVHTLTVYGTNANGIGSSIVTFTVSSDDDDDDDDNDDDNDEDDDDGVDDDESASTDVLSGESFDLITSDTISLGASDSKVTVWKKICFKDFLWWLLIATIILLILVVAVSIVKFY